MLVTPAQKEYRRAFWRVKRELHGLRPVDGVRAGGGIDGEALLRTNPQGRLRLTAPHPGIRETRRIVAKYILTEDDLLMGRTFDDTIALAGRCVAADGQAQRWMRKTSRFSSESTLSTSLRSVTMNPQSHD